MLHQHPSTSLQQEGTGWGKHEPNQLGLRAGNSLQESLGAGTTGLPPQSLHQGFWVKSRVKDESKSSRQGPPGRPASREAGTAWVLWRLFLGELHGEAVLVRWIVLFLPDVVLCPGLFDFMAPSPCCEVTKHLKEDEEGRRRGAHTSDLPVDHPHLLPDLQGPLIDLRKGKSDSYWEFR